MTYFVAAPGLAATSHESFTQACRMATAQAVLHGGARVFDAAHETLALFAQRENNVVKLIKFGDIGQ